MTKEEIDKLFPSSYGGNAQISDLRLILTYLSQSGSGFGGIDFYEVNTIPERDQLQDLSQGDICRVAINSSGNPETYIWDEDQWKVLVLVPASGGGGTTYVPLTEEFQITNLEEQYQEINLTKQPTIYEHNFVFLNGLLVSKDDYVIMGNSVQFVPDSILEGDNIIIKYSYVP